MINSQSSRVYQFIYRYLIDIISQDEYATKNSNIINIINIVYQTIILRKSIDELPDELPNSIPDNLLELSNKELLEKLISEHQEDNEPENSEKDKELLEELLRTSGISTRNKRKFLFNPNDPKKSFDVYIDKNPNDTIPIKYRTTPILKIRSES